MTSTGTLDSLYRDRARSHSNALAITTLTSRSAYTWGDLVDLASDHARRVAQWGLPKGSRIGLVYSSSVDCVAWSLALWTERHVVVPIDHQWGALLRTTIIEDAGVVAVIDSRTGHVDELQPRRAPGTVTDDLAIISYTSGSTGRPKGVMLGHRQLIDAYELGAIELTRLLGRVPHRFANVIDATGLGVFGVTFLWAAVLGIEVAVLPPLGLTTVRDLVSDLLIVEADFCYLVPPLIALALRGAEPPDGELQTWFATGGAPLSGDLCVAFEEKFRTRVLNFYGLTEVGFTAFFGTTARGDRRGLVGIGRPGIVVARLRNEAGNIDWLPDARGTLEISGPTLAYGYHENTAEWDNVVNQGWLATGDVAERHDGDYWIVGRQKDAVMQGGDTIYLGEVEAAAMNIAGVIEAAAGRLVDAYALERIGLVVRLDDTTTRAVADELTRALGSRRSPTRIIEAQDPLPRISQGKLDRQAIAALYFDERENKT